MRANNAFTLVELLVAVAVVAVLVIIAWPHYNALVARGRMGEAKVSLNTIASLQENYQLDYNKYYGGLVVGNIGGTPTGCHPAENDLGFRPENCIALRYGYTTTAATRSYTAIARNNGSSANKKKQIFPNCAEPDEWRYVKPSRFCPNDPSKCRPVHTVSAVKACK